MQYEECNEYTGGDSCQNKSFLHHLLMANISESEEEPKGRKGEKHEEMHRGRKIATGSKEDPSGSLGLTASSHWAVMRHMGHRCRPDGGGSVYLSPAWRLRCYTPG